MAQTAFRQRYTLPWSTVTANSNMLVNQGYFCNGVGNLDMLLPSNPSEGAIIGLRGVDGSGGFTITQGALVRISVANLITTAGVGGSVEFSDDWNYIYLVYQESENIWCDLGYSGLPNVT